jgi:hypothetical protein
VAIADHGPSGGLCAALSGWSRAYGGAPIGRAGLGLYGFCRPRRKDQSGGATPAGTVRPAASATAGPGTTRRRHR